jgi:tetratricopeptide (TPR) repeat protein
MGTSGGGDDLVDELLDRWEEEREQGRDVPVEVLCRDCPELIPEVARRLALLRRIDPFVGGEGGGWPRAVGVAPEAGGPRPGDDPGPRAARSEMTYGGLTLLARGGLGAVYRALDETLRRKVAVKFIQESSAWDSDSRRRFLREAEITAQLEHPGIVPVYGAGTDAEGRHCYVMRLIPGRTLADEIARVHEARRDARDTADWDHALRPLVERLRAACQAVAYAHSRGILHCDLKPRNILIDRFDVTLVADWGLARPYFCDPSANGGPGAEPVVVGSDHGGLSTLRGQGTPGFVSPEQWEGRHDEVGPASDVYSLGATLYVLLTNTRPLGDDPAKVGSHVGRFPLPAPSAVNKAAPRALEKICQKAMASQPGDRYTSVLALVDDLNRWLAGDSVSAWPDEPRSVRAFRWVDRHRSLVTTGAAVALVAFTGLAALALQRDWGNRSLDAKNRDLWEQTRVAIAERQKARAEAEAVNQVSKFLYEVLTGADPIDLRGERSLASSVGRPLTAADLLRNGRDRLDSLTARPTVRATLTDAIGNALRSLALYKDAEPLLKQAVELRRASPTGDPRLALSLHNLGWLYYDQGELDEARKYLAEALELRRKMPGDQRAAVAESLFQLGWLDADANEPDKAEKEFLEVIAIRHGMQPGQARGIAIAYLALAMLRVDQGRHKEATAFTLQALEANPIGLATDDALRAAHLYLTGMLASRNRRWDDAEANYLRCLEMMRKELGPEHPAAAYVLFELALNCRDRNDIAGATNYFELCLQMVKQKVGLKHPRAHDLVNSYAGFLKSHGQHDRGLELLRELVRERRSARGADHPAVADALSLEAAYTFHENWEAAEALCHDALRIYRLHPGYRSDEKRMCLSTLGYAAQRRRRHTESKSFFAECREVALALHGPGHNDVAQAERDLAGETAAVHVERGEQQLASGQVREAVRSYHEALAQAREGFGWGEWYLHERGIRALGNALGEEGDPTPGEVFRFKTDGENVLGLSFAPGGATLLTVGDSYDDGLRLFDLRSGETIRRLPGHTHWVQCVAVTADGRRAVTGSTDRTVRVWDLESGTAVHTLEGHTSEVLAVAVTADGRRAASGGSNREGQDYRVLTWDLVTGRLILQLAGHTGPITDLDFTPAGNRVVSASRDGTLRLWDLDRDVCEELRPTDPNAGEGFGVALSPDGRAILSAWQDGGLRLWDARGGREARLLGKHEGLSAAAFTPDGRRVVSVSGAGRSLCLWDVAGGGEPVARFACREILQRVAVSPDGRHAAAGSYRGGIPLWRLPDPPAR